MAEINKKALEHLADLSRIDLHEAEEEKLLKDLSAILDYFEELQGLDTSEVVPMTGGTDSKNVLREDEIGVKDDTGRGPELFPDSKDGYLRVPPIF
jgi:aspartyl-tRNA(Asn)/glutamyl-tRNA(Gln) amidotransferase subunit C